MALESQASLSNLFFYWLAALPVLVAFFVWFYFWGQKQTLLKLMMMRANLQQSSQTSESASQPPPYDKPPSYLIYETFPKVHNPPRNDRGSNGEVILSVEDLIQPPSYFEAVKNSETKICS